jgi:hypothetical protein
MWRVALVVLVGCARPPVVFEPAPGFDHSFAPLVGAHAGVGCASCHLFRFAPPALDRCDACHTSTHTGLYANRECTACHAPTRAFSSATFDHPWFTLGGGHARLACASCHTSTEMRPESACESCHADRHRGRFSPLLCRECHSPAFTASTPQSVWRPNKFDHKRTGYALLWSHAELQCRACHRGGDPSDFEWFPTSSCLGCHAHRTVHDLKYKDGDCVRCHMHPGDICRHP